VHCDAKAQKLMQAFVGDLAVFETYSTAQTHGQILWRQDKQAPSMVGLDKPTRIIRSDGGEYHEHSVLLNCPVFCLPLLSCILSSFYCPAFCLPSSVVQDTLITDILDKSCS
jgi:hypothetical protein